MPAKIIYSITPDFNPDKLERDESTERYYQNHLGRIKEIKMTPSEYILDTEFIHPSQLLAITVNKFPYSLPEGQKHMLVWLKQEMIFAIASLAEISVEEYIENLLLAQFTEGSVTDIWENDDSKRSVKGLRHFHFIIQD
jgi:hypothetical protein